MVIDNKVVEIANNEEKCIRGLVDPSYQGVKRLVLAFNNTADDDNQVSINSFKKYFLPRVIQIDRKIFYDHPVNDSIKQYDEIRKISTGQGNRC